jgi:hypothetical protein
MRYKPLSLCCQCGEPASTIEKVSLTDSHQLALHWRCKQCHQAVYVIKDLAVCWRECPDRDGLAPARILETRASKKRVRKPGASGPIFTDLAALDEITEELETQSREARRSNRRYDLDAAVSFKIFHRNKIEAVGQGRTVNISTRGLLFESTQAVQLERKIELMIAWPVLLDDAIALKLCVAGETVRRAGKCTAVRIFRHEFRLGVVGGVRVGVARPA